MSDPDIRIKIKEIEAFPEGDLIDRLREVTMLEDAGVRPYEHAFISLENIAVEELHPAQRYVLNPSCSRSGR